VLQGIGQGNKGRPGNQNGIPAVLSPFFILFVLMNSCTSIPGILVTRKPLINNIEDYKTIVVIPFEYDHTIDRQPSVFDDPISLFTPYYLFSDDPNFLLNYNAEGLAKELEKKINEMIFKKTNLTIIDLDRADLYIEGRINSYTAEWYREIVNGNEKIFKMVRVEFVYQIIRVHDNIVLVSESVKGAKKTEVIFSPYVKPTEQMAIEILDAKMTELLRCFKPWVSREEKTVLDDGQKNPRMKKAEKLVKRKKYDEARELYRVIYEETGNLAAAYNQAIMLEMLGKYDEAKQLLEELLEGRVLQEGYLERRIREELERINQYVY
jgi:tetratricopeptide (TPR) repeat protein